MARPRKGRLSQAEMSALVGISPQSLRKWAKEGIDITDEETVRVRAQVVENRSDAAEDMQGVKLRKLKAEADLKEHELEVERKTVVRREEMNSDGMKIGMVVKSVFQKFSSDLTPILAGRPAGEVKKALDKYAREKLVELSQYDSYVKIPTD